MKRFMMAALFVALPAAGEIVVGAPRPVTANVPIGPVPATASAPVAASSGDQFLVAWNDTRTSGEYGSCQGTRVSATGEVLDPTGLRFPADAGHVLGTASSGSEYLVVTDHWLFVVGRDGGIVRGDALVLENFPLFVVSNGVDYAVTSFRSLFSFRVDRGGHRIGNFSHLVRLAVGRNYVALERPRYDWRVVVLAPNGTVGEFTALTPQSELLAAVAGDDEIALLVRDGSDRIVRFRLSGIRAGEDIPIGSGVPLTANAPAAIGWNGSSYTVFYTNDRKYCLLGIERGGSVTLESLPFAATSPVLASSPRGALAVWADGRFRRPDGSTRQQIAALPLPQGAAPAAARDVLVSLSERVQVSPRIESIGGRQLVAFIERSGAGDEIVIVPANGGNDMLRIAGIGIHGLRAATDGNEWFLLWSEDRASLHARFRAAIVTPALRATLLDVGEGVVWDEPNVTWNESEYLVYGTRLGFEIDAFGWGQRFARGGVPLPPPFPFELPGLGAAPAAAVVGGVFYVVDALPSSAGADATLPWYEINVRRLQPPFRNDHRFLSDDVYGTAPAIAAADGEIVVVTPHGATTIRGGDLSNWVSTPLAGALDPHIVVRDGEFLATTAERITWMRGGAVLASVTLPEGREAIESSAPAAGPLTIAYTARNRIWLRDVVLPVRRRAAR